MPLDPLADGDELTASHMLSNLYNQVIAQLTAGTRPAGTAGQMIFETDTERFQTYDGSGWQQFGQLGAWTTWTPTLTQSGTVTYTVTHSAYTRIGTLIMAHCQLAVTGSGSANNAVTVSLPVTAVAASSGWGTGFVRDLSVSGLVAGIVVLNSTTTAALRDATQSTNALLLGVTGASFALGLASGDSVEFGITYEAA